MFYYIHFVANDTHTRAFMMDSTIISEAYINLLCDRDPDQYNDAILLASLIYDGSQSERERIKKELNDFIEPSQYMRWFETDKEYIDKICNKMKRIITRI